MTLHNATNQCVESFNLIFQSPHDPNDPLLEPALRQTADNFLRLKSWAGNLGAYHTSLDKRSADHRLREAPEVSQRLLDLLGELQHANGEIHAISLGVRSNRFIDSTTDENTSDQTPSRYEAEEIALSVADIITDLAHVSVLVRNASKRDRYARAAASTRVPFFADIDIRHVSDKFPKVNATPWLRDRLGKGIVSRRQYLRYAQTHHDQLSQDPTSDTAPSQTEAFTLNVQHLDTAKLKASPMISAATTDGSSMISSNVDDDGEDALHVKALSSFAQPGEPFLCPYCMGTVSFKRPSAWRTHVFQDLRAYVCTFPGCDVGLFESRSAWFQHEQDFHRRFWLCQYCHGLTLDTSQALISHLKAEHAGSLPANNDLLEMVAKAHSRPITRLAASSRPLCDDWQQKSASQAAADGAISDITMVSPREFRRHLGRHLEQLALFAVPRDNIQAASPTSESDHMMEEDNDQTQAADAGLDKPGGHNAAVNPTVEDIDDNDDVILHDDIAQSPTPSRPPTNPEAGDDGNATSDSGASIFSALSATTPPFLFRIDELRPAEGVQQRRDGNHWAPPRQLHSNVIRYRGAWMYYSPVPNRSKMPLKLPANLQAPPNITPYSEHSMYYAEGTIWVVPYDASRHAVGDGVQSTQDAANSDDNDSDKDSDSAPWQDWTSLRFGHPEPPLNDGTSFIGADCQWPRLHMQRQDQQTWIDQLLPDRYHSNRPQQQQPQLAGGMVGKLPILLGLIALSALEGQVNWAMSHCIQPQRWRHHGGPRGAGWSDRRGLVVRTYAAQGQQNLLQSFENGRPVKAYA